ncbi:ADP-heptose synthase [Effusibacillus consociatus]|uniref:ADP-heptose synthase n=1 Tax=Effusibacillus consociatus TaxID=1117041 RepID=A0ABV9Q6Y5_9BACL
MRTFVTEPVVLAMFGELLQPSSPVRYLFPLSSIKELHLLLNETLSSDDEEQTVIRSNIENLIAFFENPFVNKKIDQCSFAPWAISKPIIYHELVTFQVVNAVDTAAYGEEFDPIETELILLAMKENVPLLIEDPSIQERIVESDLPMQVFDVADFEFALEEDLTGGTPASDRTETENHTLPAVIFGGFLLILVSAVAISFFR